MEGMLGNDGSINTTESRRADPDPDPSRGVEVRLENESVWSRFHSLGTEMILTDRGRRMFPCCRFRVRGLDPHLRYSLIMDFTPLDGFRHRWNGKTWERDGAAEAHPEGAECVHPESPAPGQRWMDGPVSFYKVKLTSSPDPDRDSGVFLHPMRRYQPRLHVLPEYPECSDPLPVFSFPQTEFYAVTRYQNPLITRLKIDCNPFMLAFREDEPSARLIQNKLGLAPTGRSGRSAAAGDQHLSSTHTHNSESSDGGIRSTSAAEEPEAPLDPGSAEAEIGPQISSAVDVSMQPDLEDVDGVLFVSFTAKEALEVHVGNMRKPPSPSLSHTHTHKQTESSVCNEGLTAADRISEQECVLLTHLKQLKNTQILHPALQQVGLKLSVLDPAAPVDLHYLGVNLPPPAPLSHAAFVSRTGKTQDLTRIKGWMEKFSSQSAADSTLSAFSSDMLDQYLESEGQQISERAAVLSASSPSPVVYQMPVRSSSYVRTLDSVLQIRRASRGILRSSSRGLARPSLPAHHLAQPPACLAPPPAHPAHPPAGSAPPPDYPAQPPTGSGKPRSKRGRKRRRPQLSFSREAGSADQDNTQLREQEEQAMSQGWSPTFITRERACSALSSVLTPELKRLRLRTRDDELGCGLAFCRLGCVCESLSRRPRGSTHCRREQCMFSCGCFRHKLLLIRSPEPSLIRAFPIADPGSDSRPAPALRVTSLWKKSRNEDPDPEPIFIPKPAGVPRPTPHTHPPPPRPRPQVKLKDKVQEKEKDPVYLFLESMMTCARVREYNSNPPPQVHLLPPRRPDKAINGVSPPQDAEGRLTGPEPTKVLEILSGCNWESHRSLVLKELFRSIHMSRLSSLRSIDIYSVDLLSETLQTYETGSTLTYRVCISRRIGPARRTGKDPCVYEQPEHFPLLSRIVPAGYLKAEKATPERSRPIKVNGKTYAQAKLLLGRMGALHPANRLAAFVTGRIRPIPQNNSRAAELPQTRKLKETRRPVSARSKHTVAQSEQRKEASRTPQTLAIFQAPDGIRTTPTLFIFSHFPNQEAPTSNHVTSSKPGLVLSAVAPPTEAPPAVAPLPTVLPASALPPGQQVVLQPVAGMTGVNMCQFNGQMIRLMPVSGAPPTVPGAPPTISGAPPTSHGAPPTVSGTTPTVPGAPPTAGSAQQMSQSHAARSQNTVPFVSPTIHSVPGSSSFTLGSGLQNGFLARNNTFSFRICPPEAPGLEQNESGAAASSLLLPGGYRLIKLPMLVQPNPESSEKSSEENPTSVSVKAEPSETPADAPPLAIKEELSDAEHESECVCVKIEEPSEDQELKPESLGPLPTDTPSVPTEARLRANTTGFSCPLFTGAISALSNRAFTFPFPARTPEEPREPVAPPLSSPAAVAPPLPALTAVAPPLSTLPAVAPPLSRSRIAWLWKRSPHVSPADSGDSALMYSSDGWTTEDSTEKSSEDEVDIEALEERDESNLSRLREKARRNTRRAAPHQTLPKAKLLGVSHHAVRSMSDLPLYKRSWRLNRALRERRLQAELQQSLSSLRRTLSSGEQDSTEALLRQAQQVIGALEDRSGSLMAQKRALVHQHSHYRTLISQHSVAEQETEAPSSESPQRNQSVVKRPSRLPSIILQSFTNPEARPPHECRRTEPEMSRDGSEAGVVLHHNNTVGNTELSGVQPTPNPSLSSD
ncbi:MAX gene-associated protein isoform X2 [Pseudorasbora parva]|uniref:MAX gene-associated protein isoform X2 n=1 Tax=Pseudorasbora parva TaxID=51549 RepID=UPI00351F0D8F